MNIVIFSAWRADSQRTIKSIPINWHHKTMVVVPQDQLADYQKTIPKYFTLVAHDRYGIGNTKQWMLDNHDKFDQHVCMMDDDLDFTRRKDGKLVLANLSDMHEMFVMLSEWLREFAHVGISLRAGNNTIAESYIECARCIRVVGLDIKVANEVGVRYDRTNGDMEDFDATLQLLEAGYKNRVSYEFASGQAATNTKGGVSTYRTHKTHTDAVKKLVQLHPGIVRMTTNKKSWAGLGKKKGRVDVIIRWKRAFRPRRTAAARFNWGNYLEPVANQIKRTKPPLAKPKRRFDWGRK